MVKVRDDLNFDDGFTDMLFLEIKTKSSSVIIGVLYRPPNSNTDIFNIQLGNLLVCLNQMNKKCIIMGDFNIDIAKEENKATDFLNTLYSTSFYPTINKFTRVSKKTKTIIDNIITNLQNYDCKSGVLYSDISDHYAIMFFTNWIKRAPQPCAKRKVKVLNNKTLTNLNQFLQTKRWDAVYNSADPNHACKSLIHELTESFQAFIPEKTIKHNVRNNPWITRGILKSIGKKNKSYNRYRENPNNSNKNTYITYKNKLTSLIRVSKKNVLYKPSKSKENLGGAK